MKKLKDSSKHKKKYKDESLEDEEYEDYEDDEFENDSFLVRDDEVEEEDIYQRPRIDLGENDIGEAELESEVGSSDNEVIYEQKLNKKKSRLKKHKMTEEEYQEQAGMDYQFEQQEKSFIAEKQKQRDESFIENEEEEENDFIEKNQNDYISRDQRKIITGNKSLAHKIFTRDPNEEEEPYHLKPKECNAINILMRDELADDYMRPEDIEIKKTDVPERIFLKFKGSNLEGLKQSIDSEADWILEKMRIYSSNSYENQIVSTKKKIEAVLEFHKKNFDDIPYIVTYKRNIYEPELAPKDIWKIFELDREWNKLFELKQHLSKAFDNIRRVALSEEMAEIIYLRYIENAKSITQLNDMEVYIEFLKEMHHNEFQNLSEDISKNLRPNKSSIIQNFRRYHIDDFARKFAYGAFELSCNLEALVTGDQNRIISPPEPDVQPEKLAEEYICTIFDQEIKVMTAGCKFLAFELFSFPFIRDYARNCFKSQCTISTEPTEEGKKELDGFHPSFRVKRMKNKPIDSFNNDLFLDILEAEKKGWINVTVNFGDNFFKELTEKLNHTYHSKQINTDVESVSHSWRVMREETIRIFVAEHCIPYFKKEVKQDLKEKAENFVINESAINFSKMLMTGPYRKKKKNLGHYNKDDELLKEEEYPKVLSAIYDNAKNEVYISMIDNNGEILEVAKFNNLMTRPAKMLTSGERDLKKEDEEKLKAVIQRHKPDLIVIGANDLKCKYLKEHIGSLEVEGLRESDENKIWTTYGDITIPRISANCPKVEKYLPNLNYFYRQAICLGRFKQNPLAEICQLWHEEPNKNFCLSLPLHPLQRNVNQVKLLEQLESEAVKVVNSVGVDINKSCEHQHLHSLIQFISGLGPRKANYLIEKINRLRGLLMRVILVSEKIFGEKVFVNCSGFLKVKCSKNLNIYDFQPLDITRIHPENYPLANKIARAAMDDRFEDNSSEPIRIILRDPKKINCLNLEEYIRNSQEKGNKHTKFIIYFIKAEFTIPFNDERPPHKDLTSSELFYLLIGDPLFKKGQMVNANVLKVDEEHVKCRLTNDLEATIWYKDIYEDNDIRSDEAKIKEMKDTYKPGMILNARVKSINEVNFKIDLTLKPSELISVKNYMDVNRLQNNFFVLVEEEDYINRNFIKEKKIQQTKYQQRNISYQYFKNYNYKQSLDFLRNKEIGAFVYRPSSKGENYLTLSWKFYDDTFSHLEILEEEKQPGSQIGKRLRLGNDDYGSLLEITDRYLKPCEMLVRDAVNSRKFKKFESMEEFERKLKEEKNFNKSYFPYLFTILSEYPQYIVMGYSPKVNQVIKEFIKVKPTGYYFHNEYFQTLEELSNWFKRNYTSDSYRDYVKKIKAPQVEETRKMFSNLGDENSISFDFGGLQGNASERASHFGSGSRMDLEERNALLSGGGSSYERERNYGTDSKPYRDRGNKAGKACHHCKEYGHFVNECPNKTSKSQNRDYNRSGDSRSNNYGREDRDYISHKRNRSPNKSENSGQKSYRNEDNQTSWAPDSSQSNQNNNINNINANSWTSSNNNNDSWQNANTNNNTSNVQNNSELGWNSSTNVNEDKNSWNANNITQGTEIGWAPISSNSNSNNNINNNSYSNNNFSFRNNRDRNFNNNKVKCHNCNEEGHISKNCPNPRRNEQNRNYSRPKTCNKCNKEGHLSYNCPEDGNNYSHNNQGNDNFRKPKTCFNCQEDGHFAKDCTKPKNNRDNRYRNESGNSSGNNFRRDSNNNYNRRDRNFNSSGNNLDKHNEENNPNSWTSKSNEKTNEENNNENRKPNYNLNEISWGTVEETNNNQATTENNNNNWGGSDVNNEDTSGWTTKENNNSSW